MVFEIFMPCYFGNELIDVSKKLNTKMYQSNWTIQSKKFKTAMKIFMENAKNPLKVSVFGVFDLNLETFLRIINSAYSLYVVLGNLDG